MKKVLSVLLSIMLLFAIIPTQTSRAASNIVINGVDIGYAVGDYFTKNGKSCATAAFSNGTCHGHNICITNTDSRCNCLRYWPSKTNQKVDLGATQCFGFARFCQWKVYGYHDGNAISKFTDLTGIISASNCTASTLKSKLLGCAYATHIRTKDGHSMAVIATSNTSIQIVSCNMKVNGVKVCKIYSTNYTWESFASYLVGRSGVAYSKAFIGGKSSSLSTPTPTPTPTSSTNPDSYPFPSKSVNNANYKSGAVTANEIKWVQAILYQFGYLTSSGIDGKFGPSSTEATKKFQSAYGLSVDGSAGSQTLNKMKELWNSKKVCTHTYSNACDATCNSCGKIRSVSHTYSNACDASCNSCGAVRSITHKYQTYYESAHPHAEYKLCNCGSKIYTGNHKKVTNCSLCENPMSYSFTTVEGKTVYTYSKQYDVTVTIFSHNLCNNSKNLISAIAQNSTLLKNTTQVLFVDANKNTKQTVSDLKKSLGATKVEFCYDLSNKAYNAMWKYANDAGFGNSITLPIIVFTKKDGTVFKVLQGEVDPDYFFQLAKGDLSQDMSVNLNISGTENYDYANEVLKKLNDLRKRLNLQTLTMDQNLLTAAMQRAAEISIYYSHTRPNGTTCSTVSTSTKINAENIAIGQNNPADVMNSWTNSSGHYANMTTADFKSVGIGCFTTSEGYLCWVQVFSKDSPTTVSKSGTVSAAHVIKATAAHLSLALYVDKDPHLLKKGESTKLRVENINKGFDRIVQKLNISDFSFKSNNDVVSFNSVGNCTAYGTGKVTITAEHKQSESVKALGLYTIGHNYTNSCDTICNICKAKRTIKHKYTNACDTTCNVCKAKRTIKHTYSNNCDTSCNVCKATRTIIHAYKTTTTKATLTKSGSIVKKCTVCGKVASKSAIKYVKTFKLSATTYTYDSKVKTPSVTVKDSAGKTLKKNTDYTVTYASGRKNVGTYKVTIKMKGKYSGTKTLTFKITPAKTTVSKLTAGKKSITVAITKKSTQVTGYQIQYSTSKTFSKATTKTISSYKTTKYTLKSLSAKKTYYVRVRTYKTVGKTKYYSGWSTYKYVKTK